MRGEDRHMARVTLARWQAGLAVGVAVAMLVAAIGAPTLLWREARRHAEMSAPLLSRLAEQQVLIELYRDRVREVALEVESWGALHAKIWEPFRPEPDGASQTTGVGGRSEPGAADEADATDPSAELARLVSVVHEEGESLRSLQSFLGRASRIVASLPSRWPLRGPINSDFGTRRSPWTPTTEFHDGVDIGAPVGTPVEAPAPGKVVFAGRLPEYGIAAILDHGNETRSLYGHLSRLNVRVDQTVERGEVIAWSGSTGRSSGPHLHYEIQVSGRAVNPHSYFWE
jgi:murein DD-endopeptidase MepM/ murein hydrolase activator NlpD